MTYDQLESARYKDVVTHPENIGMMPIIHFAPMHDPSIHICQIGIFLGWYGSDGKVVPVPFPKEWQPDKGGNSHFLRFGCLPTTAEGEYQAMLGIYAGKNSNKIPARMRLPGPVYLTHTNEFSIGMIRTSNIMYRLSDEMKAVAPFTQIHLGEENYNLWRSKSHLAEGVNIVSALLEGESADRFDTLLRLIRDQAVNEMQKFLLGRVKTRVETELNRKI